MSLTKLRRHVREILLRQFLRLIKTEEVRHYLNRTLPEYGCIRQRIQFSPNPYGEGQPASHEPRQSPVFITGRFRSGSTLLWNIFRNLEGYTAYYEPFNERRWFSMEQRGDYTDGTHRGVSEYWSEYTGLAELGNYYHEDWIRHQLYMDEHAFDFDMKAYINTLVAKAKGRAVLQFNRVDFRLGWLRSNYPEARIVHIYRNPRDQWCSVLRDPAKYPSQATSPEGFPDHFYLGIWVRDLCRQFPFLAPYQDRHQYYLFYCIWKLSYCFGCHYADVSVAMEDLANSPESTIRSIIKAIDKSDGNQRESVDLSFVTPAGNRWLDYASASWFQAIEEECDAVIDEFLQGGPPA
ncbi:Sulfotransferase family protein [Marinobacter daqiaonensis]|uniref:Sulfotransferase family protein n=1 Tax=Marinobacter daqiaonensis TaxID=650891 RepID=A0A1I6HW97_9GAMM|nr:sulfotransferase [Marinobacter daqiaonensis]SFR58715.1 Sulfotransferase family protein [Marinobacter daqiaonensis]